MILGSALRLTIGIGVTVIVTAVALLVITFTVREVVIVYRYLNARPEGSCIVRFKDSIDVETFVGIGFGSLVIFIVVVAWCT